MAARFLALVDSWASPSAVLCARRDPGSETGARMIPELTSGAVTAAAERALAKLFTDYPPGTLTRPTLVRPTEETSAFKVRDTLVVPWAHGPALEGFLVLRGLPRPEPPNLGDAVALLAEPLWARVAGRLEAPEAPAGESAAEGRLSELRRLIDGLEADLRSARGVTAADVDAAVAEVRRAREQAESERDAARAEATELRSKLETEGARAAELLARSSEAEKARDEAVARAEAADRALTEGGARAEELAEARQARERAESERDAALARAEATEKRAAESGAKPEEAEDSRRAREQAESERDAARAEATELRSKLETEGARAAELLTRASEAEKARDEAVARAEAANSALTEGGARAEELTEARQARERAESERDAALARAEAAEKRAAESGARPEEREESRRAHEQAEAERDAARAEAAELKSRLETLQARPDPLEGQLTTLQDQIESLRSKLGSEGARAAELLARASEAETARDSALARADAAERERDEARATGASAEERSQRAETDARTTAERWGGSVGALRSAVEALRRTPFVPPTVRVLFTEAEAFLQAGPPGGERLGRVLLLDRDAPILSGLAGELEQDGVDVLIAHYADEVTLYLKTPEARDLTALVLDVLALRPDQNVVELVRGWRRDLPSLAIFLTFRADNPTEAERAQRLPSSTTAGYIPRPLAKGPLLEAVTSLARRAVKRG
jgi:hypothetical protein